MQPIIVHTPPFLQGLILQSKIINIKKKKNKENILLNDSTAVSQKYPVNPLQKKIL